MLGPVFPVEVITTLRRTRYFVARAGYALVLGIALWFTYISSFAYMGLGRTLDYQVMAAFAASFFYTFAVLQLLAVLAVTPAVVAGTIAEERSRRTIEYLFATQLRNTEIVLGKLIARLVPILLLLAGGLPILAIVMSLGGVAPELLAQAFAVAGSTLLWVTAMSICISVFSPRGRDAVTRTYGLVFLLLTVPPLVRLVLLNLPWTAGLAYSVPLDLFTISYNPMWVLPTVLFDSAWISSGIGWQLIGTMALVQLSIAAVCVVSAVLLVRRAHLHAKSPTTVPAWSGPRRWRRAPGDDAMYWKELFVEARPLRHRRARFLFMSLVVLGVVGFVGWLLYEELANRSQWYQAGDQYYWAATVMTVVLACLAMLMIGARAAASITLEKEQDTWISLLCTPLEPRQILRAKVWGNLYSVRVLALLFLFVWSPALVFKAEAWVSVALTLVLLGVIGLYSSLLGVWFSLRSKTSVRALTSTLLTLLIVGGAYMFCCMPLMFAGGGASSEEVMTIMASPCIPFLFSMAWTIPTMVSADYYDPVSYFATSLVFGVGFYLVVSLVLWQSMINFFDEDTGRSSPMGPSGRRPGGQRVAPAEGAPSSSDNLSAALPPPPAPEGR